MTATTPHTALVEKVARAIYEARNGRGCQPWGRLPGAHKAAYLLDARTALAAVRDALRYPSDKMRARVAANGGLQAVAWAMASWPDLIAASPLAEDGE